MKKLWSTIKFILGGSFIIPNFLTFWGLAFATFGIFKPVGIVFGYIALVSTIFSFIWFLKDRKKNK